MKTRLRQDDGFTLMEMVFSLSVMAIGTMIVGSGLVHVWSELNLQRTAATFVYHLRDLQEMAQTESVYTEARVSIFTPSYELYRGTDDIGVESFAPGVNYRDGYLQMPTGTFVYNILGDAYMAGVVRLVDGENEQDIHLYMGAGCQSLGRIEHEPT